MAVRQDQQELQTSLTRITEEFPEFPAGQSTDHWAEVAAKTHEAVIKSCPNQQQHKEMLENLILSGCNLGLLIQWDDYRQKSALKY